MKRIQRKRTKGWRMPEGAVYVGRGSRFGNPFRVGSFYWDRSWFHDCPFPTVEHETPAFMRWGAGLLGDAAAIHCNPIPNATKAVALFRRYVAYNNDIWDLEAFQPLRGKDLACWCPLDQPCHADVLLEIANAPA